MTVSRHVSVVIDRSAGEVYDYASAPVRLVEWASGLADSTVEYRDNGWVATGPMGSVQIEFTPTNDLGVLDHFVTTPDGQRFYNPMRVAPLDEGCEVIFTVRRRAGMTDADFESDVDTVTRDLGALKERLES